VDFFLNNSLGPALQIGTCMECPRRACKTNGSAIDKTGEFHLLTLTYGRVSLSYGIVSLPHLKLRASFTFSPSVVIAVTPTYPAGGPEAPMRVPPVPRLCGPGIARAPLWRGHAGGKPLHRSVALHQDRHYRRSSPGRLAVTNSGSMNALAISN